MNDLAARSEMGATAVVDRTDMASPMTRHDAATTRDFPLPSRSARLGLGGPATSSPVTPAPDAAPVAASTTQDPPNNDGPKITATGRHRSGPPAAMKARAALVAVAAGAVAMAVGGSGATDSPAAEPATTDIVPLAAGADGTAVGAPALASTTSDLDGGVVPAASKADMGGYGKQLAVGKQLAAAAAARDAAARKPMFAAPIKAKYSFTSAYAERWGSFHGGVDLAAPLGTPIHAVSDGVVIEAGPASGYGNWVQVKAADGTVTMYGHMASSGVLVKEGQKVTAGDIIALVGSEGFSTGPHLHFEVWRDGSTKIDPIPWLAAKGVSIR
ncbi:M23 family metallopeptidase [Gordonia alkaliphila]|uniref:M23 family metallopeptidase n=1 Tax=Gordonia alkaliphila TaxID=1053547 RepID=UPI0031EC4539